MLKNLFSLVALRPNIDLLASWPINDGCKVISAVNAWSVGRSLYRACAYFPDDCYLSGSAAAFICSNGNFIVRRQPHKFLAISNALPQENGPSLCV